MKKDRLLENALLLTHFLISHAAQPNKALPPSVRNKYRKNLVSCASREAVKFVISYRGVEKNGKLIKKVSGQIDDYLKGTEIDILPCLPDEERIQREIWFPRKKRVRQRPLIIRLSNTGKNEKRSSS